MYESVARVHTITVSTIINKIIINDINCNHMRQKKLVRKIPNIYSAFGVNKSTNWLKKVSTTSNYQYPIANDWKQTTTTTTPKGQQRRHASSPYTTSIIINWNNIRCRLNSRSRHLLPTQTATTPTTTHFERENILTNLNVHFECDNRHFFNTSPKIYSR